MYMHLHTHFVTRKDRIFRHVLTYHCAQLYAPRGGCAVAGLTSPGSATLDLIPGFTLRSPAGPAPGLRGSHRSEVTSGTSCSVAAGKCHLRGPVLLTPPPLAPPEGA